MFWLYRMFIEALHWSHYNSTLYRELRYINTINVINKETRSKQIAT